MTDPTSPDRNGVGPALPDSQAQPPAPVPAQPSPQPSVPAWTATPEPSTQGWPATTEPPAPVAPAHPSWPSPVQPLPAPQPAWPQPAQPQPAWTQPVQPQPAWVSPNQPQPAWTQPVQPQPAWVSPNQPRPDPQPAWAQPSQPGQPVPTTAYPPVTGPYPVRSVRQNRGLGRFILPLLTALLAVTLVGTGIYAYATIQNLNTDITSAKASLTTEHSARGSAEHQVSSLKNCLTAMKADLNDLESLQTSGRALLDRMTGDSGDWSKARSAYEDELAQAYDLARNVIADLANGNNSRAQTEFDAMLQAEQSAAAAETMLESMSGTVFTSETSLGTELTALQSKMVLTKQTCDAAIS